MNGRKNRIGIMGGTFDPIHIGHLVIAENACQQLNLEKVLFLPAGNPPHKREREGRASGKQRIEMVRRAIAGNPHFELSLLEMEREGYTYTYRTLESLKEEHPDEAYYFIIGADSLYDFKGWLHPERICACASIVVATRNHTDEELLDYEIRMNSQRFHGEFIRLNTRDIDISSRQLRAWIAEGRTIKYYVPDSVIDFIEENRIYWR
ncbi:MAG TPA: nicotinate-nicotinamide nucleotide adenylyltransferase [Lachnospiraceae bacterium]|nr:nicotinate-nicotinamide nucleotide adenylyltransferase [Lachnospiraceae bacterium]